MANPIEKFDAMSMSSSANPPRVLVVEDHLGCLTVMTAYLDICGCVYDVAQNGEEAVQKAKAGQYALILMDVKMQDMDGFEATRRIREFERDNNKKATQIMGVTAYALVGDKERCVGGGHE